MGVATGWGGGKRLVDLIGPTEALKLLIGRDTVDFNKATQLGLCDLTVSDNSNAIQETKAWIGNLVGKLDPEVTHAAKSIVSNAQAVSDLRQSLANEASFFSPLWGGRANKKALQSNLKH